MNDPIFRQPSISEPSSENEPPQFGALDIVEAFTAMRHECRGQTKESRALAEQIQAAVTSIESLEAKLLASLADTQNKQVKAGQVGSSSGEQAKPLVQLITEIDHQLSRAVAAIEQWETKNRLRADADFQSIERYFARMNGVARWFARPLLNFVTEQSSAKTASPKNPAIEGLNLVLARLQRAMNEQEIERIETLGQPFDADTMYAIGTVDATDYSAGSVAEQLSPAYRWQGRLIRFAEVRIAQATSESVDGT